MIIFLSIILISREFSSFIANYTRKGFSLFTILPNDSVIAVLYNQDKEFKNAVDRKASSISSKNKKTNEFTFLKVKNL